MLHTRQLLIVVAGIGAQLLGARPSSGAQAESAARPATDLSIQRTQPDDHPKLRRARLNVAHAIKVSGALEPTSRATQSVESEQRLVREARTALNASDYTSARAKINEAVDALLATPESQRDDGWLALLASAAGCARDAQDARASKAAWTLVLDRRLATLPDDHPDLQRARQGLALALRDLGQVNDAYTLLEKVLDVRARAVPQDAPELLDTLFEVSIASHMRGDIQRARSFSEQALELAERTLPEDHSNVQVARGNLAAIAATLGDYRGARPLFEKALEVNERTLPESHKNVQLMRENLARTLAHLGDLEGALALSEKNYEVCSRTLPDEHKRLQAARGSLAAIVYDLGDYTRARELYEKVLAVNLRTLPEDHPDVQSARTNVAALLIAFGDLHGARVLQEQALEVDSRRLPEDHPHLVLARQGLAVTLQRLGELQRARLLFEQVLEARLRSLPEDHPNVHLARNNLGSALRVLGDASGSRALLEQVLAVQSRTLPDDHVDLQITRHNLAAVLRSLGDLDGARALQEKVLEVRSRSLPDDHIDLQGARQNLAVTRRDLGDLRGARALEEEVLEAAARTLPDDHFTLQRARQNLAVTLKALGEINAARELEQKVLEVHARALPDGHPDLQAARINLAETMLLSAERTSSESGAADHEDAWKSAALLLGEYARANTRAARDVVLASPSREAEERCSRLAYALDAELSLVLGFRSMAPQRELAPEAFAFSELARGAAIATSTIARRARSSPQYAERRSAVQAATADLARLAREGASGAAFESARQRREAAEQSLVDLSRELSGDAHRGWSIDAGSLAAVLGGEQVLVAFRRFQRSSAALSTDRRAPDAASVTGGDALSLCAFVVRHGASARSRDAPIEVVDLGPLAPIERAIGAWRDALGAAEGRGLAASAAPASLDLAARGDLVRRLVLDPLAEALGHARHVIVVPDDVLHLVPFDALPVDERGTELVGDRMRIDVRSTSIELLETKTEPDASLALVCLGDVRFDLERGDREGTEVAQAALASVPAMIRGGAWTSGFTALPGTRGEIDGLEKLFGHTAGSERALARLDGADASKERLVELAPRARFLHVATHGWFAPESIASWSDPEPLDRHSGWGTRMRGDEAIKGMSPMLLCGLALAGANAPDDAVGRASGLITAEELSTLDLSNCELAVLSACDTNVGERRAGQGVASLQKALQMAGARSVITSLWKVPDEATKELMLDFYRRLWVEKKPKHQALWEAKTKLREAKDERGEPKYTTRDWAAWVLTGDPR